MQICTSGRKYREIDQLVAVLAILICDLDAALAYDQIKAKPKANGQTTPENDVWFAATAARHQLTLVTRDHHFLVIDGLQIESR